MRRPLIAGNWKLHFTPDEAEAHARSLHAALDTERADIAVFPTTLALDRVQNALRASTIAVGAQWASQPTEGAHTGQNALSHIRSLGCSWLLIGHSEVRAELGATDSTVGLRVQQALACGLAPMICVGESLAVRDAHGTNALIEQQVRDALAGLAPDQIPGCAIAYEPLWAIGTGRSATPDQAQEVHAAIRAVLLADYPPFVAAQTRILYGGSVKPNNAASILACPDVDGVLVGGASLNLTDFCAIAACTT